MPSPKDVPGRRPLWHEVPPWIDPDESEYFVTICCRLRGVNQLCRPEVVDVLLTSARFYGEQRKWFLAPFLVMPDHVHMLASFARAYKIEAVISAWKRYTATKAGVQWQDRFFEHRLRSNESAEEKCNYILNNPLRAGLVEEASAWPYVLRMDRESQGQNK